MPGWARFWGEKLKTWGSLRGVWPLFSAPLNHVFFPRRGKACSPPGASAKGRPSSWSGRWWPPSSSGTRCTTTEVRRRRRFIDKLLFFFSKGRGFGLVLAPTCGTAGVLPCVDEREWCEGINAQPSSWKKKHHVPPKGEAPDFWVVWVTIPITPCHRGGEDPKFCVVWVTILITPAQGRARKDAGVLWRCENAGHWLEKQGF